MIANKKMVKYYDESREFLRMPLGMEKTLLAVSRLENPYRLSYEDYLVYWDYLSKQRSKTVNEFIKDNRAAQMPLLVKYKVIKKTSIDKYVDYAHEQKKIDVLSYLLEVANEFRSRPREMDIAKKLTEDELSGFPQLMPTNRQKVGDVVWLGEYPIPWQVLENRDGRLLLISKFVLDCEAYHEIYQVIEWKRSTIRTWLNGKFFDTSFSDREKSRICDIYIDDDDEITFDAPAGAKNDRLFFLNLSEAFRYFKSDEDRRARLTKKARNKIMWTFFDEYAHWWLRTPAVGPMGDSDRVKDRNYYIELAKDLRGEVGQSYVRQDGVICTHGGVLQSNSFDTYYEHYGVRPRMYFRTENTDD